LGNCIAQDFVRVAPCLALDIPAKAGDVGTQLFEGVLHVFYFLKEIVHV
jgi:hypothetical protein